MVAHEPLLHDVVEQRVRAGDDAHADMVRHIGAHHRKASRRGAPGREVGRLIEAVPSRHAERLEAVEVFHPAVKVEGQRQKGRVGRDDAFPVQPPLHPKRLHAVRLVLVV